MYWCVCVSGRCVGFVRCKRSQRRVHFFSLLPHSESNFYYTLYVIFFKLIIFEVIGLPTLSDRII